MLRHLHWLGLWLHPARVLQHAFACAARDVGRHQRSVPIWDGRGRLATWTGRCPLVFGRGLECRGRARRLNLTCASSAGAAWEAVTFLVVRADAREAPSSRA